MNIAIGEHTTDVIQSKERETELYLPMHICMQTECIRVCVDEDRWSDRHTFDVFHIMKQKLEKEISGNKGYYKFSNELNLTKFSLLSKNNDRMGKPC